MFVNVFYAMNIQILNSTLLPCLESHSTSFISLACGAGVCKMAEMLCARISLLTLTFCLILSRTRGEMFTALIDLENLVYRERELRFTLEEYVNSEEQRIAKLKKFLAKVNAAHNIVGEDVSRYLGHPVNSYLEIRRMYKEWPEVERLVQLDNSEGKRSFFREISQTEFKLTFYRSDEFKNND